MPAVNADVPGLRVRGYDDTRTTIFARAVRHNSINEAITAMQEKGETPLSSNMHSYFPYMGLKVDAYARQYINEKNSRVYYRVILDIDLAESQQLTERIAKELGIKGPCGGENVPLTTRKGKDYLIYFRNESVPERHKKFSLYHNMEEQPTGNDMARLLQLAYDSVFYNYIDTLQQAPQAGPLKNP